MGDYYKAIRNYGLYNPQAKEPFRLSRSKIDDFMSCARCFYLDRRLGVGRPSSFPFNLNNAVDTLLKREFDILRSAGQPHLLMKKFGVEAIPAKHPQLEDWRINFTGVQFLHAPTNLLVFGAIDDLWINGAGEHLVVDYKATSKNEKIEALDQEWQIGYKRQMEVYQWLLRGNGLSVSNTGYFVYCNGNANAPQFDAKLEFDITLVSYTGSADWVEPTLVQIKNCLDSAVVPESSSSCNYCQYRTAAGQVLNREKGGQQSLF